MDIGYGSKPLSPRVDKEVPLYDREPMGLGGRLNARRDTDVLSLPPLAGTRIKPLSLFGTRSMSPKELQDTKQFATAWLRKMKDEKKRIED